MLLTSWISQLWLHLAMRLQWWFTSFFPSFLSKSVSSCFSYCHGNTAKYTQKCNKPSACKKVCTKTELLTKQGALLIRGSCRDISGGGESLFITSHYQAKWKHQPGDKTYQDFQTSYRKGYQHQVGYQQHRSVMCPSDHMELQQPLMKIWVILGLFHQK